MADDRVIGRDNKLPWHFKSDLEHFKKLTMGGTLIMGRKTFDSIGRALPGRENFVLSRATTPDAGGARFFTSLQAALKSVRTEAAYIIGGEEIFRQTMDRIDGIYLTRIRASHDGDARYPEIPSEFREISSSRLQEDPILDFVVIERVIAPRRPPVV